MEEEGGRDTMCQSQGRNRLLFSALNLNTSALRGPAGPEVPSQSPEANQGEARAPPDCLKRALETAHGGVTSGGAQLTLAECTARGKCGVRSPCHHQRGPRGVVHWVPISNKSHCCLSLVSIRKAVFSFQYAPTW